MYAQISTSLLRFGTSVSGQNPNNDAQNTFTYLKGIIQLAIYLGVSAHVPKIFHASIKDLRICSNNPALEDFVIQNHL